MIRVLISTLLLLLPTLSFASFGTDSTAKVAWTGFEKAVENNRSDKKLFILDVYTDWCGWCKVMDRNTFSLPDIASYLNQKFHPVKLNAETHDTIRFEGKIFVFKPDYRSNELAISLLSGKMSYPSVVFLDENYQMLTVVPGYIEPDVMRKIMHYFGDRIYLKMSWEDFEKQPK